jgi:hypothetical protein
MTQGTTRHRLPAILALAATLSLAAAAPASAQPKLTADPDQSKSDTGLLQDEAKATAEFQRRVRGLVRYQNGLLIIQDRAGNGVSVAPATIFWMVDCGEGGLTVTFGAGSADTDNGIALPLTGVTISSDTCQRMGPAIGEIVLGITKGN